MYQSVNDASAAAPTTIPVDVGVIDADVSSAGFFVHFLLEQVTSQLAS